MATLLLNASHEPLRIIDTRRAIVLVLAEKAEVLEAGDDEYHSARTSVPVPEVIRLRRYVQLPYSARIPLSNAAVLRRDDHRCAYCLPQNHRSDRHWAPRRATTVDHVVPRSRGGKHSWLNVVAACRPCNAVKAAHSLDEIGWDIGWKPYVPTGTKWLLLGLRETRPTWAQYLIVDAAVA